MAATYTPTKIAARTCGNRKAKVYDIAMSGTYTTGGDALTPASLGMKLFEEFIPHGAADDGTVQYPIAFVYSSNKVKLFESGGAAGTAAAEKGAGESLTSIRFRVTVVGP